MDLHDVRHKKLTDVSGRHHLLWMVLDRVVLPIALTLLKVA